MQREQCKVGMTVSFGRANGERTVGVVEKLNQRTAKVRATQARGKNPVGTLWNVQYSFLKADGVEDATAYPIGQKIVDVRLLTRMECESQGWDVGPHDCAVGLVLSDGSVLFASQDYEGNGPGALFGRLRTGESFVVSPSEVTSAT